MKRKELSAKRCGEVQMLMTPVSLILNSKINV